jgi:hypothetical protein
MLCSSIYFYRLLFRLDLLHLLDGLCIARSLDNKLSIRTRRVRPNKASSLQDNGKETNLNTRRDYKDKSLLWYAHQSFYTRIVNLI